jgi:hypothetical protein
VIAFIYVLQIALLLTCLYMIWRVRLILNGLARGFVALILLLILRRSDDALHWMDETEILLLSSAVVLIVAYDIFQLYRNREIYAFYFRNREQRIEDLERQFNPPDHPASGAGPGA